MVQVHPNILTRSLGADEKWASPFPTHLPLIASRWPLRACALMSDTVLPLASTLFVVTYWAIGLFYYYTWPEMQELCIE